MPRSVITTQHTSDSVCIHTHLRAYYTLAIIISAFPLRILPLSCVRGKAQRALTLIPFVGVHEGDADARRTVA